MRLAEILFRNSRAAQNEKKVPFKAMTPMTLKSWVTSKNQRNKERGCWYEISLLLTCLEENNFEEKNCVLLTNKLNACYEDHREKRKQQSFQYNQKVPVPNSKSQTYNQITHLLRKYPII